MKLFCLYDICQLLLVLLILAFLGDGFCLSSDVVRYMFEKTVPFTNVVRTNATFKDFGELFALCSKNTDNLRTNNEPKVFRRKEVGCSQCVRFIRCIYERVTNRKQYRESEPGSEEQDVEV